MNVSTLEKSVNEFDEICKELFLVLPEEKNEKEVDTAQIINFVEQMKRIKTELSNLKAEKIKYDLMNLFDIDISLGAQNYMKKLDGIITSLLSQTNLKNGGEEKIKQLQILLDDINEILHSILAQYYVLNLKNFTKAKKRGLYKIVRQIEQIKFKLITLIEFYAIELTSFVVADFYQPILLFSYSIEIFQNEPLILIEVLHQIERMIGVIEPIFAKRSLKSQDLLYHYVNFELYELKTRILQIVDSRALHI